MKNNLVMIHLFLFLICSAITLTGCSDSSSRADGSGAAFGEADAASKIIAESAESLGPTLYNSLCSTQQSAFYQIVDELEGSQAEAYDKIQFCLKAYVNIIEREPNTRIARLVDEELLRHINFLSRVPGLKERWIAARQMMAQGQSASR